MEGSVLDGRYRLERLLGSGGMGDVWLAEDTRLGRWVAVKWLRDDSPGGLGSELEREARLVARLQHPNIVGVSDVGRVDARPYLVMDYVHGVSVRELIAERGGRVPEAEAVRYGAQVAEALGYAHEQGIFHSDVKPENILVSEEGVAKAADFGIAQTVNRTLAADEARGILGTIAYLAPEVIQGEPPGVPADIYSLGLTIYEMIAGRLPFTGSNPAVVAGQRLGAPAPLLRTYAPEASVGVESVLARALALDPAQRWATARDFARALRQTRSEIAPAPVVRPPEAPRQPPPAIQRRPSRGAGPPVAPAGSSRSGMWVAIIVAGLLAIGAGVAAALIVGSGDDEPEEQPSPSPATATATLTPTPQPTNEPTHTPTATPTETPEPSPSPSPSPTPTPTPTEEPESPTPTGTTPGGLTPGVTLTPLPTIGGGTPTPAP